MTSKIEIAHSAAAPRAVERASLQRFVALCIDHRVTVCVLLAIATAALSYFASGIAIKTDLDDLAPRSHPYMGVHEKYKLGFGGSNIVSIVVTVKRDDIFSEPVLRKVQEITTALQHVDGVNQFQIVSLASRKLKDIQGSTEGIDIAPLMWPQVPASAQAIAKLKESVLNNLLVYGAYVSQDLKSALITVDFYDTRIDYKKVYDQVMALAARERSDDVTVSVVGEPILFGWVNHFLPETLHIFLVTVGLLILLLFISARTWRGTLLPLLSGVVSAVWALGFARLAGINVDPLVIVVAFLITARAISHSVQLVTRFDDEIAAGAPSSRDAAMASMSSLFKPGILGVVADAGCMAVVLLTPISLMQKVAIVGAVWVLTISISAVVLTPVLLSWIARPNRYAHPIDISRGPQAVLSGAIAVVTSRWRYVVVIGAALLFVGSGLYSLKLTVGDANAGSPILWPDSEYNRDAALVNREFQGSDRMFVVFAGKERGAIKDPDVLQNIGGFQKFMAAQPEIGGSLSVADVLPLVQRTMRESNPRYQEIGRSSDANGELLYMLTSSSEPGDMARFVDTAAQDASVMLFFRDHRGETIRTAVSRVNDYTRAHPTDKGQFLLAGGLVGELAAINEVLLSGQIESIAFALLVLVICCVVTYRSATAGIFFMVPVLLSNALTFAFMAANDIGMNINTVPVAALGIGLGVDYAFYIVDGIKEELAKRPGDLNAAIVRSLRGAGRGVLITAATLIVSVVLWGFSSLRFQAEMALLMGVWLFISATCALFLVPAMVGVFRPRFVMNSASHEGRQF